jgi:hypothetical protein
VYAAAAVVSGRFEDGYSPVHRFVSELAAEGSGVRVLMTIGFLVLGASIVLFAWSLRVLRPAAGVLALIVALSGAGTLTAGTFSCDPGCPVKGSVSTHQDMHNRAAVVTFSAWVIAPFVAARQLRGTKFARVSLVLGLVGLAIALLTASYSDRQPRDPVGLLEVVLLLVVGAWFVATTVEVRSRPAPTG